MSETQKGAGNPVEPDTSRPAAGASDAARDPAAGPLAPEAQSLLDLVDRLGALLEKSDLAEIEIEAGETGIVLRKPAALAPAAIVATGAADVPPTTATAPVPDATPSYIREVKAPLTGVFYAAPSPTAPPYVTVGQKVEIGQVIGLIEAMKLFNEIKSDQAGRVTRMVAESGKLVKAKQTLIEVEPA
jgi:acetyl-CoA carboxylase biotin carboxyl carrier protein